MVVIFTTYRTIYAGNNKIRFAIQLLALPLPISIILTTIFYLMSIRVLKAKQASMTVMVQNTIKILYSYAFVQLVTVGPRFFAKYYILLTHDEGVALRVTTIALLGLAGFANTIVYYFQRKTPKKLKESFSSSSGVSEFSAELERKLTVTVRNDGASIQPPQAKSVELALSI